MGSGSSKRKAKDKALAISVVARTAASSTSNTESTRLSAVTTSPQPQKLDQKPQPDKGNQRSLVESEPKHTDIQPKTTDIQPTATDTQTAPKPTNNNSTTNKKEQGMNPPTSTPTMAKPPASTADRDSWQNVDLATLMEGLDINSPSYHWEDVVDNLITRYDPRIVPDKQRKGWKTVRLFISSTFKDMWNERDYLVKKVFPHLRQWSEERKIRLIECDLRWGVPKDADEEETLLACLSEIDRCREENIYPYFLNLLSDRYGWVPTPEEVPHHIQAKYKWIPGMSVTTLEIMTGGYWDRNPNALYLFRDPNYISGLTDANARGYYQEKTEKNKKSLHSLKGKLRSMYPRQVNDYTCKVEEIKDSFVYMTGFEKMGEHVLKHFKSCMEKQYPTENLGKEPSLEETLKMEHETFMIQRSQVLLGREKHTQVISEYIGEKDATGPLLLVGYPGSGKSALMAYGVKQCLSNPKHKVFYHFIGATPRSTDLFQILQRFFLENMPTETKMPQDTVEMQRFSHTMFETAYQKAMKEGFTKFVIFIDALNQMDDDGDAQYLGWLPKDIPTGMKVIVSTLEGKSLNSLRNAKHKPLELDVEPLDKAIRQSIVTKILAEYNKKLDTEQMEVLTSKSDAGRPLWLTIACEELRVFGEFRKLTQKITDLPDDIIGLNEVVLTRVASEFGGNLVVATLCLIETSRFGLLETELLELLTNSRALNDLIAKLPKAVKFDKLEDRSGFEKLPMAKWALVYVGLRQFLRPCGSSGEGRLDFHHRTISKVVRKMYLPDKGTCRPWHTFLGNYFEKSCTDMERKSEELPYHIEMAEDREKLKNVLISYDMFSALYNENNKQQLMRYWRFIGGYSVAAKSYIKGLAEYLTKNHFTDLDKVVPIQTKTAWFLSDIGEYDTAVDLLKEVITKVTTQHGDDARQLADPTHCMVNLLYRKALQYVYGAHPGYQECRKLGNTYSQQCSTIHLKYFREDDPFLGHVLTLCGYFHGELLEKAKVIFEKTGDQQGLGQVLYMLGEKNQYNSDMNVPIQYFQKSVSLCMATYGRVHLHTARALQLYGQLYWNSWTRNKRQDWLETCLEQYEQELEILTEILGPTHVTTVRSREDVIIILQSLGRSADANEHKKNQPKDHQAL